MINNATQQPKVYYCRHMQPGTARYENETILVDGDGMKGLLSSVGKRALPVYINHQDVDLKNIKEQAVGYVTDSFYNELDGWGYFKFVAVDDSAHEAIKKGWSVSNAYMPTEWGPAGTKNNVPYAREVRNGEFTHLAIVPDPRYEGACIMTPEEFKNYNEKAQKKLAELKNSKEKSPMFKLFKNKKEEVSGNAVDLDTHIELENGKSLSIREMVEAVVKNSKNADAPKVKVGEKEMTVEELVEAFTNAKKKMKKNGSSKASDDMSKDEDVEGDEDEEGDDEIGEDKKNKKKKEKKNADGEEDCMNADDDDSADKDAMKNKKKEKKNSSDDGGKEVEVSEEFFNNLRNAHLNPPARANENRVVTSIDGIERGKQRYGSAPAAK
jgi:hypothetical protein